MSNVESTNIKQEGRVTSLKKYSNGTATADAMIIYNRKEPVINTSHKKVLITKEFLKGIEERFNKKHKGIMGFGKRYPKLILNHEYNPEEVVGRIDSPLELRAAVIEDRPSYALFCKVLISEPTIIDQIESGELYGLSSGIYFDDEGAYLKELTLTPRPTMKQAMLLSEDSEAVIFSNSDIVDNILSLQDRIKSIESAKNRRKVSIQLSQEKQQSKKEIRNILLEQVDKNKLLRRDVEGLVEKCYNTDINLITEIFSKVAPLKKNRGSSFRSMPIGR